VRWCCAHGLSFSPASSGTVFRLGQLSPETKGGAFNSPQTSLSVVLPAIPRVCAGLILRHAIWFCRHSHDDTARIACVIRRECSNGDGLHQLLLTAPSSINRNQDCRVALGLLKEPALSRELALRSFDYCLPTLTYVSRCRLRLSQHRGAAKWSAQERFLAEWSPTKGCRSFHLRHPETAP
jgi:hypothetical protein